MSQGFAEPKGKAITREPCAKAPFRHSFERWNPGFSEISGRFFQEALMQKEKGNSR
jgi:hypothetical protein